MTKRNLLSLILACFACSTQAQFYQHNIDGKVSEFLKNNIVFENDMVVAAESPRPYSMQEGLYRFYERRNFEPAWIDKNGVKTIADSLLIMLKEEQKLYGSLGKTFENLLSENEKYVQKNGEYDEEVLGNLEVNFTRAFVYLADMNLKGYVLPSELEKYEWYHPVREADLATVLEFAIMKNDIREGLESVLPKRKDYWQLVGFLGKYEKIKENGGWKSLPESITEIEIGAIDDVVLDLKKRLEITESYQMKNESLYDDELVDVVSNYQRNNGLEIDGEVGSSTLKALNIPVEERISQLKINIERYKWLPEERGRRHIWVNIPEYMLRIYEDEKVVKEHIVVVGSKGHKTPLFSSRLTNLVINPYWNVPYSIARNEIIPKLQKGTSYLTKQRFDVIDTKKMLGVVDSAKGIDWTNTNEVKKQFRFRQKPGPGNALGRIKFNLPNDWSIYLHDTPSKRYFSRAYRAVSHGCIRVHDPVGLAASVIRDDFSYNKKQIEDKIRSGQNQRFNIDEELPVHLIYMTAWVDESGTLQFRDDIYGKDVMHAKAIGNF
ncbi:MAG: murein L,D-transpeptidase YcbB/YkuD [Bacteroidia bacterium]|jgi:murein L,D-transpeptidase YcbB/YkuD